MENTVTPVPTHHAKPFGLPWLVFLLLVVIVLSIGSLCFQRTWQKYQRRQYYQAVFLTNDQVYYGHLRDWDKQQVLLTDVYYAQAAADASSKEAAQPQYVLVKLSDHATGPQNKLFINREHILYVEDLQPSSQIVQVIQTGKQ
ncbi:MAG: hypothetical protein AAB445_01755 [Patescibacteria group bacterium]